MATLTLIVTDGAGPDRVGRNTMNTSVTTDLLAADLQGLAARLITIAVDELAKAARPALDRTAQFAVTADTRTDAATAARPPGGKADNG